MRFYTVSHKYYCGIDLHTQVMYLCILDQAGEVVLHRNMKSEPQAFLAAIAPYREDLVVGAECIFCWYWLADLCEREGIRFVLGHALYMKAIHGGKVKNDKFDSAKIAGLLRGGMFPLAYVYPAEMRSTRDLLRRRQYLVRQQSELLSHVQNTNSQWALPQFAKKSAGKKAGPMGRKIGNAHLKWAFSEAVCLMMRELPQAKAYVERQEKQHGKGKAMSMLAHNR